MRRLRQRAKVYEDAIVVRHGIESLERIDEEIELFTGGADVERRVPAVRDDDRLALWWHALDQLALIEVLPPWEWASTVGRHGTLELLEVGRFDPRDVALGAKDFEALLVLGDWLEMLDDGLERRGDPEKCLVVGLERREQIGKIHQIVQLETFLDVLVVVVDDALAKGDEREHRHRLEPLEDRAAHSGRLREDDRLHAVVGEHAIHAELGAVVGLVDAQKVPHDEVVVFAATAFDDFDYFRCLRLSDHLAYVAKLVCVVEARS